MIKKVLLLVTLCLAAALCGLLYEFWHFKSLQNQKILDTGKETTQELSDEIERILKDVMLEAHALRDLVLGNTLDEEALEKLIASTAKNMDEILGITVAYEPYAWNESTRLYSPYYDKKQERIILVEEVYDYTDSDLETASWYVNVRNEGAQWVEPYYAESAQALVADYGIPFFHQTGPKKGLLKGTVTMTISLNGFTEIVQALSLGKTGYGFVSSREGQFLAHPISDYIGIKGLKDLLAVEDRRELIEAYQAMLEGETGHTRFFDEVKAQDSLFFYNRIETSNWKVGVLFYKQDILGGSDQFKSRYINLALAASLLCFFIITIIFNRDYLSVTELWQLSVIASTVLILNILLVGYLQHNVNEDREKISSPPISNNAVLSNVINQIETKAQKSKLPNPTLVPFGLYLERMEFRDSYNLNISGKAWMKFENSLNLDTDFGFRFPQTAPFAEATILEEIYRKKTSKHTLVGYDFRTTMRLNFDYSDYPFDKRHIALEIRPLKVNTNIMLIPDLQSYAYTNPLQKSGISNDIRLPGNEILESYFSYRSPTYNTRFGYTSTRFREGIPSLYFNINVKRILITSFVTYLIPIFVSLVMIFILICSAEKSNDSMVGGGIIQGLAAFFFVLIFSHIDLRKDILTGELVYMEYYYFAAYLMIMFAAYNLIIFTRKTHKIFDFRENIIMKTTYWPTFFLILLSVTLIKFY